MLKAILSRQIDAFERRWNYKAGYMRDILAAGPGRHLRFGLVASLGQGRAAPAEATAAAGITATLSEDCGPSTQISVDMAEQGGVDPSVLRAVLAGDQAAMTPAARLGYRFAAAVLAKDADGCDAAREEIRALWGSAAVVDLSLAVTMGRMYPTVKFGLGHARACARVTVSGQPAPFHRPEVLAA